MSDEKRNEVHPPPRLSDDSNVLPSYIPTKETTLSRLYRATILCKWSSLILSDYKILLIGSFLVHILAGFLNIYDSVTFYSQIYGAFAIVGFICTCCNCSVILYLIINPTSIYTCLAALALAIFAIVFTVVQYTVYTVTLSSHDLIIVDIFLEVLVVLVQLLPITVCYKLWYYLTYNYDGNTEGRPSSEVDSLGGTNHFMRQRSRSRSRSRGSRNSLIDSKLSVSGALDNEITIKLLDNEDDAVSEDFEEYKSSHE